MLFFTVLEKQKSSRIRGIVKVSTVTANTIDCTQQQSCCFGGLLAVVTRLLPLLKSAKNAFCHFPLAQLPLPGQLHTYLE